MLTTPPNHPTPPSPPPSKKPKLSASASPITPLSSTLKRGAFILLEGVDRCGKTTQCSLLLRHLLSLSIAAVALRFPDRETPIGTLIDGYLRSGKDMDDRSVHLLFSANRWEASGALGRRLVEGKTVVCDRYAYSGVAFSSAKEREEGKDLSIGWCKGPDVGLPAPDCVIFLDLAQEEAEKRGGYGGERYEKRDLQIRVRRRFSELQAMDEKHNRVPWHIVDASKSVEDVQADINAIVNQTLARVADGAPLLRMFEDGEYKLPLPPSSSSSEVEKK